MSDSLVLRKNMLEEWGMLDSNGPGLCIVVRFYEHGDGPLFFVKARDMLIC
jgi:hypothetical protein